MLVWALVWAHCGNGGNLPLSNSTLLRERLQLFRQLFEKMRRSLAQEHLQRVEDFGLQFAESGIVRGRVSSDPDHDFGDRVPLLVIDGEPISWKTYGARRATGWKL